MTKMVYPKNFRPIISHLTQLLNDQLSYKLIYKIPAA